MNIKKTTQQQEHDSKLRGMSDLVIDAVHGVTNIVESMHGNIQSRFFLSKNHDSKERARGISGFVYKNIRYITNLVGIGADKTLITIEKLILKDKQSHKVSYSREAILSALNGILGDHLVVKKNPLAIKMQFRSKAQALTNEELIKLIKPNKTKILLMIHGLCMNDLQWKRLDHNHGEEIAGELAWTPLYLHYNTGLHVSENGQSLSAMLEDLYQNIGPSFEINVIAHSMGGLVIRSAMQDALVTQKKWLKQVKRVVFLGTPHHGARLEKLGNWLDSILSLSVFTKPFTKIGKIRSSGITDLRYGNLLESDWSGEDRFEFSGDQRTAVPLHESVNYFNVTASKSDSSLLKEHVIGDGLVSIKSSLGQHHNESFCLNFEQNHIFMVSNTNHMQLLSDPKVYQQIKLWFSD